MMCIIKGIIKLSCNCTLDSHALVQFFDGLTAVVPIARVECRTGDEGGTISLTKGDSCEVYWSNKKWYKAEFIFSGK